MTGSAALRWEMLDQRQVVASSRADVFVRTYRLPDGMVRDNYVVLEERSGVLVVAITDAEEVLLVRQYRAPIGREVWELPAGAIEPGETNAEERACKELQEETGYTADEWRSLGTSHAAPHRSTETDYGFLALRARRAGQQDLDPGEAVHWRAVPLDEVRAMVDSGEICSGPTLVVLFKALRILGQ